MKGKQTCRLTEAEKPKELSELPTVQLLLCWWGKLEMQITYMGFKNSQIDPEAAHSTWTRYKHVDLCPREYFPQFTESQNAAWHRSTQTIQNKTTITDQAEYQI